MWIGRSQHMRPQSPSQHHHARALRALAGIGAAALLVALAGGCGSSEDAATGGGPDPFGGQLEASCDGNSGGFGLECEAKIEVIDVASGLAAKNIYNINTGDVGADGTLRFEFEVRNGGNKALGITKIEMVYEAVSPDEAAQPALSCENAEKSSCEGTAWPIIQPLEKAGAPAKFAVVFRAMSDNQKRSGVLRIHSTAAGTPVFSMAFSTASGTPKISVSPDLLDFKFVQIGSERIEQTTVFSIGNSTLKITKMELKLDKDLFRVIIENKEYTPGEPIVFDPPLELPKGNTLPIKALYAGKDDKPHNGTIQLHTNDPSLVHEGGPGVKAINVKVNSTGPCLLLNPSNVVFGATPLGKGADTVLTLKSCGDLPVEIHDIRFAAPGKGEFDVDFNSVAALGGAAPTADKPLVLEVNKSVGLTLKYNPDSENPVKDGKITEDSAVLEFHSNIVAKVSATTLTGFASSSDCPNAVIKIPEGDTVVPQTNLNIDGSASFAKNGKITKYRWEVDQPNGSVGLFKPNAQLPKVQFQPNVAGDYTFRLRVWDAANKESCVPAEKKVKVLPDEAIHVELLWTTPGDPDQSDEGPAAGADLDLHFAHPFASGLDFDGDKKNDPWFDPTYDAFWYNKNPEWGSYDPNIDDNPSLDRDDTDGAGPENLNLTLPEDGMSYSVGVHYFNDFAKGPSTAEVRIYIYGQLQFQVKSEPLNTKDMWYVATVDWPSGNIAAVKPPKGGKFFVTPKYPHPTL